MRSEIIFEPGTSCALMNFLVQSELLRHCLLIPGSLFLAPEQLLAAHSPYRIVMSLDALVEPSFQWLNLTCCHHGDHINGRLVARFKCSPECRLCQRLLKSLDKSKDGGKTPERRQDVIMLCLHWYGSLLPTPTTSREDCPDRIDTGCADRQHVCHCPSNVY